MSNKALILSLYRSILKTGFGFKDYNFQKYIIRRTIQEFHRNQFLKTSEEIQKFYKNGLDELEMLKRQKIVQNLYG